MTARKRRLFRGWVPRFLVKTKTQHPVPLPHPASRERFIGALVGLRYVSPRTINYRKHSAERFVYVGCVHGGNGEVYERLEKAVAQRPDYLVFAGDLTGSAEIERLKKWFYDTKDADPDNETLKRYEYFGYWAAHLPKEKRRELLDSLETAAQCLVRIMKQAKAAGTRVLLVEGNWDNPRLSGINVIAGADQSGVFNTKRYIEAQGFSFTDRLTTLETESAFHIFLPFATLLHFDLISGRKIRQIRNRAIQAQDQGKPVIMVGHAEANWRIHHLWQTNPKAYGRRGLVIANFGRAMGIFRPDEVIYPHQHARIRDEKGRLIAFGEKYLLHAVRPKGKSMLHARVHLIDDITRHPPKDCDIVATYIPFGMVAAESFSLLLTGREE